MTDLERSDKRPTFQREPRTRSAAGSKTVKANISRVGSGVSDAKPDAQDVKQAGRQAVGMAQAKPLGLAVGAAALGFLAGMLIPRPR